MSTPTLEKCDQAPEAARHRLALITVTFRIRRFNPEVSDEAVWEDFQIELDPKERVLDAPPQDQVGRWTAP
ncbi:Succinate dehydrogenase iron-sulfur subunit OS=Streptomyces antimycoticus OX=68175 GN=SANT12839_043090 PE=3 SV=1 [Streptomyces antimycoticus]